MKNKWLIYNNLIRLTYNKIAANKENIILNYTGHT